MSRGPAFAVALLYAVGAAMSVTTATGGTGGDLPAASFEPEQHERAVPGELIVRFAPRAAAEKQAALAHLEVSLQRDLPLSGLSVVEVPEGRELEFAERLRRQPGVAHVEDNLYRYAMFTPNDEFFNFQWHLQQIGMETAWDTATGAGVTVAVIDTGVHEGAPDWGSTPFVDRYDFVDNDLDPTDPLGHGTHVASTISEATNNTEGVAGVAFDSAIMPLRILDENGMGTVADEVEAINWAVLNDADVINLSLGGECGSVEEQTAINAALAAGVVVVAAAGNGGPDGLGDPALACPAGWPGVIAVGATRFDMNKTFYSNYGIGQGGHIVDMVAPGGDVFVDQNSDGLADGVLQQTLGSSCPVTPPPPAFVYCTYMGTSMATPHVAGVAALVLEVNPALTPGEVRNILANSAEDLGPSGCDVGFGYGLVDAAGAVAAAQDSVSNPVPAPSTTCDAGADYDEDGCKDIKEFGQNPVEGGARDATDFWDFFDTPGTGAGRDKAVNSVDIFSVVQRFGSSGTGTTIADALMSPPPAPAYHAGYDRSAVAGSFSGPADGAINSADIFVLVGQFGHACG